MRRNKYEVVVKTATFERHLWVGEDFFWLFHLLQSFVAVLKMEIDMLHYIFYIIYQYHSSKAVHPNYYKYHDAAAVYPQQELKLEAS